MRTEDIRLKNLLKDRSGILSIEAAIALTSFMFLIMFLVDMGRIYQAQNYVTHGLIQTSKSLSAVSFELERDTNMSKLLTAVEWWADKIFGENALDSIQLAAAWEDGDMEELVQMMYGTCAAGSDQKADDVLKRYGLKDGVGSISFQGTCLEDGDRDLLVKAQYTVELPFKVFGYEEITLRQNVRSRLWKKWRDQL
ncbi:pilus assembly protein [Clostridium sp. AM58-1XD]|nr:pilus assembly protein [Clostridium sp. AM58-1XD]